ncbi:MAG: ABC transporter permease, partial [Anaerolineales bacterium]
MQREGSPWQGIGVVMAKEIADHLTGIRILILELLVALASVGAVYGAVSTLRETVGEDPFLFLRLFTTARDPLPGFVAFLGFLTPLVAIALGFDTINGEFNRRTMSRVLAQPIYRDALLAGKFLSGLATLSIVFTAMWLLVAGLGVIWLGVPPGAEEVARGLVFLLSTILYGGVWLGLAIVFSVVF